MIRFAEGRMKGDNGNIRCEFDKKQVWEGRMLVGVRTEEIV